MCSRAEFRLPLYLSKGAVMNLRERLESDAFIVTAEMGPPQSAGHGVIRKKAAHFTRVDGVNITDNQTGIVRLSSIAAARICLEEGLEPVIQVTCRDRNRIAIQSDLLGAAAMGIENILCLTGDYPTFGDHPEARPVYDLDSIQLIALVSAMNEGTLLSGQKLKTATRYLIGGAANPFARPLDARILRLKKKISNGARFIQTQPVFDLPAFHQWMERVRQEGLNEKAALLAGVMPVKSVRALTFMRDQVPGMRVHPDCISRMASAKDPEEEGVRMAVETINRLRETPGIRGIHLMPLLWESITPVILEKSNLARRTEP